jgi:hypothetical protein
MKKLILEIPDWVGDRQIYVFFGRECYAIVDREGKKFIKVERCNYCGLCCEEPGPSFPVYTPEGVEKEYCAYCVKDADGIWHCENPGVPYDCIREDSNILPHKNCVIKYKVE